MILTSPKSTPEIVRVSPLDVAVKSTGLLEACCGENAACPGGEEEKRENIKIYKSTFGKATSKKNAMAMGKRKGCQQDNAGTMASKPTRHLKQATYIPPCGAMIYGEIVYI